MIVEGAFDAAAVTAAGGGSLIGLAPCGTALTPHQLATLAGARATGLEGLVVGFDDDPSGRHATARTWDLLTPVIAATCAHARWGTAKDPAELTARDGADAVAAAISTSRPLAATVVEQHLSDVDLTTVEGRVWAARRVAASIIPALDQQTIDEAGAAYCRALAQVGQPTEAADAIWLIAHTEALVAHSLGSDHGDRTPSSGLPELTLRPSVDARPEMN